MAVVIKKVLRKSPLYSFVSAGDSILKINGNAITDIFDYDFYLSDEEENTFEVLTKDGVKKATFGPMKDAYLEFDSYLMDKEHSCKNKCIFCFIDQLPKGLRPSLYFKDDDARLSFLFGNYITLTNLKDEDIERIGKMHISPVNISVHTTNPELRVQIMKNKSAGEVLRFIPKLHSMGIKMNCQIVLCRGINDGEELKRTIEDLSRYFPMIESISAVPAGLTRHRDGLPKLSLYDKESSAEVIDIIEEYGNKFKKEFGDRLCYPSDEFFIKAERPIPDYDYYEQFYQLENGVGMVRLFSDELDEEIEKAKKIRYKKGVLVTGKLFYTILKEKIDKINRKFASNLEVLEIRNDFFGENITVTGLICGCDIIAQTEKGKTPVFIPDAMLKADEDVFLDDVTLKDLRKKLGRKIIKTGCSGKRIAETLFR